MTIWQPSGAVVNRWESSQEPVPADARAVLTRANRSLSLLLTMFRPGHLPQVIRQKADLFHGESARDWILQGRIQKVADLYDAALAYQG